MAAYSSADYDARLRQREAAKERARRSAEARYRAEADRDVWPQTPEEAEAEPPPREQRTPRRPPTHGPGRAAPSGDAGGSPLAGTPHPLHRRLPRPRPVQAAREAGQVATTTGSATWRLLHGKSFSVADAVLGLVGYAALINLIHGGPAQLRGWFGAKFLNRPWHPATTATTAETTAPATTAPAPAPGASTPRTTAYVVPGTQQAGVAA